jgi:hypothetical protein
MGCCALCHTVPRPLLALTAVVALTGGCTIYTTQTSGAPTPRPRARSHRAAPPAAPRPAAAAAPAPVAPAPATAAPVPTAATKGPAVVAQPGKNAPPQSKSRAQPLAPGAGTGRPHGFRPQAAPAYWIWQGPRGHWRLRTTSKHQLHVFRGRVRAIDGTVSSIQASRNEFRDRMWQAGDDWAFSFKTKSHADGFTFEARGTGGGNACVKFDLQLDGGPEPKRIFVGRSQVQPASNHFVVCPKGAGAPATPRPGQHGTPRKPGRR